MAAVWEAGADELARTATGRFMATHGFDDYPSLQTWSAAHPDEFWDRVVDFLGIEFTRPYTRVRDEARGVPWTTWFADGAVNLSAVCLDRWADDPHHAGNAALIAEDEAGAVAQWCFAELRDHVARLAGALAARGIGRGDRVAMLLGLGEAIPVFLAVARLGAVAVPIFSGFGAGAVTARLVDGRCRALVTSDRVVRRGVPVPLRQIADHAIDDAGAAGVPVELVDLADLTDLAPLVGAASSPADPVETGVEEPVLLAYTSGTTGRPKGAVHVHGGFTVKLAQEGAFQADLRPGDRACWLTDMGWIMGPWITVAALANGAAVVALDGAPDWPDAGRVWRLVERHRVTFLGVSPTLVRSLAATDHDPPTADVSSLRAFGSTGEPWNPAPWWWLFDSVGRRRRPIVNLSGGTEVGACLVSVNLAQGCAPCSVGGPALGVPVDVVDPEGRPVRGSGRLGELVVRGAWPGMTRGIWGDPDRYVETYWSQFPGMWRHGDWAEVDDEGFWFLHGRSDDTLNVAGKRIGPAEIESVVVGVDGVVASAAVGLPHPVKGEVVGLWCVAVEGADTATLAEKVGDAVAAELGRPFRPAHVSFVPELPQTRSAKIVRRAIRARATGTDPGDFSTLEDPAALDHIERVDLQ